MVTFAKVRDLFASGLLILEDHEENATYVAEEAKDVGIKVYTIGIGTEKGGPIPIYNKYGNRTDYRKDRDGNTTQISAHKLPLYNDMSSAPSEIEVETIHSLHHSVNWQKGSRWSTGANISGMLKNKEEFNLELETIGPIFFCKGIGYQHDEWKHGIWKGESETGYEVWDLDKIDPADYTFFHTHQIVKATLGSEKGFGMLENLVVGRHDPSGFEDFFDGAK